MNTTKEKNWRGINIGASIKATDNLTTIKVPHPEKASEKAIQFSRGGDWIPFSMISGITWQADTNGVRRVIEITIPDWIARSKVF